MVVEDVVCAIKGVRVHLDEYRRLGSRKSPNEYAPANRTEMATRCIGPCSEESRLGSL